MAVNRSHLELLQPGKGETTKSVWKFLDSRLRAKSVHFCSINPSFRNDGLIGTVGIRQAVVKC